MDTELTLTVHLHGKPDMTTKNWTTAKSRNNNETGQDLNLTVPTYSLKPRQGSVLTVSMADYIATQTIFTAKSAYLNARKLDARNLFLMAG